MRCTILVIILIIMCIFAIGAFLENNLEKKGDGKWMGKMGKKIKVLVYSHSDKKYHHFNSVEDASVFTTVSEKRILWCIRTGRRWRTWMFDEDF